MKVEWLISFVKKLSIPKHSHFSGAIMICTTLFLLWAAFFEIDESVRGQGRVVPFSQPKILQHLEGGIVAEILVREGDAVENGTVLYRLEQAFFDADLREQEIELFALNIKEERINAMIQRREPKFLPALVSKIPDIVRNELQIFESENKRLSEQLRALEYEVNQKKLEIGEMSARLTNLELELALINENLAITETLLKAKVASRREYLIDLSKKQNLVTQIGEVRNKIPVSQEQIRQIEKRQGSLLAENESKFLTELGAVRLRINQLEEKKKASLDRNRRQSIESPTKGIVNKLYFHTIGGIIKSGDKVAEITPLDDNLLIEAEINPSDRAKIWVGQRVVIEITAYDMAKYGFLDGELTRISPDSTTDQKGKTFYPVSIKATQGSSERFGKEKPILPGMVANVNILTGKKSILEYLVIPIKRIGHNSLKEP